MVSKAGHIRKQIRIKWNVLKCVVEGRRRTTGPIVRIKEAPHRAQEDRNILHTIKRRKVKIVFCHSVQNLFPSKL